MIRKRPEPRMAPWQPFGMKQELAALAAEADDLLASHNLMVNAPMPTVCPPPPAVAQRARCYDALSRAFARVPQAHRDATHSVRALLQALPLVNSAGYVLAPTHPDPLLDEHRDVRPIPVASQAAKEDAPTTGRFTLDLSGKKRALALDAETKLAALTDAIERYKAERARVQPQIRDALLAENAAAARQREALDALCGVTPSSPATHTSEPEPPALLIDFNEAGQS